MDDEMPSMSRGRAILIGVILAVVLLVGCPLLSIYSGLWGVVYTRIVGVQQENANTSVLRCTQQYLTTKEKTITTYLDAIAKNDVAIANLQKDPSNQVLVDQLNQQSLSDAYSVYGELDSMSCQKDTLYADMGKRLQPFFDRWNGPTQHDYSTLNP